MDDPTVPEDTEAETDALPGDDEVVAEPDDPAVEEPEATEADGL